MRLTEVIDQPKQIRRWGLKLQQLIVESEVVSDVHVKLKPGRYPDEITLALTHPCIDTYFLLAEHNSVLKLPDTTRFGEFLTGSINDQDDVDHMLKLAVMTTLAAAFDGKGYSMRLKDRTPSLRIEFAEDLECYWDEDTEHIAVSTQANIPHFFKTVTEAAEFINDY